MLSIKQNKVTLAGIIYKKSHLYPPQLSFLQWQQFLIRRISATSKKTVLSEKKNFIVSSLTLLKKLQSFNLKIIILDSSRVI